MTDSRAFWSIVATTFVLAAILTLLQRRYALSSGLLDLPNARSSHTAPTPRSGGVAIAVASLFGFCALRISGLLDAELFRALLGGGVAISLIGYLDDRFTLSALLRLLVQLAASVWLLYCLGGVPPLSFGGEPLDLGWWGQVLGVAAIVWVINLFNFMDGIDGIAAVEAIFVSVVAAVLLSRGGELDVTAPPALVFAAGCAGFLLWNWPPAKIFMGDVGSGFLGFTIASLTLGAARDEPAAAVVFLILGGVFFVDATCTLIRRMARGEHFYQAHRIHAYQWLARRFRSHARVLVGVVAVNLIWLAPIAALAVCDSRFLLPSLALALLPLVVVAFIAGAGRREEV